MFFSTFTPDLSLNAYKGLSETNPLELSGEQHSGSSRQKPRKHQEGDQHFK